MTALTGGKARLKTLLSRMVRWRVGLRWYATALGLPVGVYVVALSLNVLLALARSQRSSSVAGTSPSRCLPSASSSL